MTRAAAILILLIVVSAAPAAADFEEPPRLVIDVKGAMLVGTFPAAIDKLDDGDPVPDAGLDPVSRAIHNLTTEPCFVHLELRLAYRSVNGETPTGTEEAVLRLRLEDANGTVLEDHLVTGGAEHIAHDAALATNATYVVALHHMLGPRVTYDLEGWLHHNCP